MAWLRNKKTGGWFQVPDDQVQTKDADTKERQIAQNEREAKRLTSSNRQLADERTQTNHREVIKELSSDKYEDGTYDVETKKSLEFDHGYQVTFCQIGDTYTNADYARKVNECLRRSSNGKTYAGKFEGTPEISFHWNSRAEAVKYAKANNQISVWDWENCCEIKTGGTGKRRYVK